MPTFAQLASRVTPEARKLFDFLWAYYLRNDEWPTHRQTYSEFKKEQVLGWLRPLDGAMIRETEATNGQKAYQLPLLGILATTGGPHYQEMLHAYLGYLRDVFFRSPATNSIKSVGVREALKLTAEDTALLGRLVFAGFLRTSGGYQKDFSEWGTNIPSELEDLPSEGPVDVAFQKLLDRNAEPPGPVFLADRMALAGSSYPLAPTGPEVLPGTDAKLPRVFISYSHDNREHKRWALGLAERLHQAHIDVIIDQWDLGLGDDIVKFMEQGVTSADRVLMLCTPPYVQKVNEGKGGAGYEGMIVTGELINNMGTAKFVPLFCPPTKAGLPTCVGTRLAIDFSAGADFEDEFKKLVANLRKEPPATRPPRGPSPVISPPLAATPAVAPNPGAPAGPAVPRDLAIEVYRKASHLASSRNLADWQRLVTVERQRANEELRAWRKSVEDKWPKNRKDLPEFMLGGVASQQPLFAIALAGVDSQAEKFRCQGSLIYDLLQPRGWERSGYPYLDEFPDANAFVFHALLGAMTVHTGQVDLSLDLATQRITDRGDRSVSGPLFLDHALSAWPPALETRAIVAWTFLNSLPENFTWLAEVFGDTDSFRSALSSYYLFLGWLEYLHHLHEHPEGPAKKARLEIPPLYHKSNDFPSSVRLLLRKRSTLRAYGGRLGVPETSQIEQWPNWCELLSGWLESVFHSPETLPLELRHFAEDLHR